MNNVHRIVTPWGYQYILETLHIEKANQLIKKFNGIELDKWSKKRTHGKVYQLDSGAVITTSYVDATLYSSLEGYLSNLQTSGMHLQKHIPKEFPIQHIRYSLAHQKIIYYRISAQEKAILLNSAELLEDRASKAYITYQGEIIYRDFLFMDKDSYQQFRTLEAKMNKEVKKRWGKNDLPPVEPLLMGKNPYGEDFPMHISELTDQLQSILNCPSEVLNYKENSVKKLEKYFYRNLITASFADNIFLPLLAYIGEVFIRKWGGQWVMRYDHSFNHWYPDVKTKEGVFKDMFRPLLKITDHTDDTYYPLRTILLAKAVV